MSSFHQQQLNEQELQFVTDVIAKELFFSIYSDEETDVMKLVRHYVKSEKEKIDDGYFDEADQEKDSRIAASILKKLHLPEEERA